MKRALGIIRQSDTRRADIGAADSLEVQRGGVEAFSAGREFAPTDWLVGPNSPGGSEKWARELDAAAARAEAGEFEVVVVAWSSDRLVRDAKTGDAFIRRMDAANVEVWTTGGEQITFRTADSWERAQTDMIRNEAYTRRTRERVRANKAARVEAGLPVGPRPKLGYKDGEHGGAPVVVEAEAALVRRVFDMKGDGATETDIRAMLADAGHRLTLAQVRSMLRSEFYLGRIVFGDLRNDNAQHEAIVTERQWNRAHEVVKRRGRKPKSDRLLARIDRLHCGAVNPETGETCGARLVVGSSGKPGEKKYPTYKCTTKEAWKHSVTISAEHVETIIEEAMEDALSFTTGRSSADLDAAEAEVERIEAELAKARRLALKSEDEDGFAETIRDLKAERDEAKRRADDLRTVAGVVIMGDLDFHEFPREMKRELIETMIESATVAPAARRGGRLVDSVTVVEEGVEVEMPIVPEVVRDRVEIKLRASADAQRTLDAAAATVTPLRYRKRRAA